MPFNNDQFFYAALYWLEALPGGEAYAPAITEKYGKPYIPMQAPKRPRKEIDELLSDPGLYDMVPTEEGKALREKVQQGKALTADLLEDIFNDRSTLFNKVYTERGQHLIDRIEKGITEAEATVFFDTLYSALQQGLEKPTHTSSGSGAFIQLQRRPGASSLSNFIQFFSETIEAALTKAKLDRDLLPRGNIYIHDNGQLFSRQNNSIIEMQYPGRPKISYAPAPKLSYREVAGMEKAAFVCFETFYRVIPLEPGKTYKWCYPGADGKTYALDCTASPSDKMIINCKDLAGLETLTDEELINRTGNSMLHNHIDTTEGYTPGVKKTPLGRPFSTVEVTSDPRIVRDVSAPILCIEVTDHIQIGYGYDFALAKPGDKLLFEYEDGGPRVVRQEALDSGKATLIPASQAPSLPAAAAAPAAKAPKP